MKIMPDMLAPHGLTIDLNADLGEGSAYDNEILACISSTSIACGGHAGDRESMRIAVESAIKHKVAIGAHPSFPDKENFGRTAMQMPAEDLYATLVEQITTLRSIALAADAPLVHVKPHGALYNQAARDPMLAQVVVCAVRDIDPALRLYALAGSELIAVARAAGLAVAEEVFADRRYDAQKNLISRSRPDACIDDAQEAAQQAMRMIELGEVMSVDGQLLKIQADTVCLHGDGKQALELARLIRQTLDDRSIAVRPLNN
jgi:5-oxoprolinase (ATP-hydrolysing) subunit A